MKLMDIDSDKLGIPDTDYDARVTLSSAEFSRIVRDLSALGESVRIEVSKEGVRFAADGESANGNVLLKPTVKVGKVEKKEDDEDEEEKEDVEEEEEDDEPVVKKEKKTKVKKENTDDDDIEMNGDDEGNKDSDVEEDEDEDEDSGRKRKKKVFVLISDCTFLY